MSYIQASIFTSISKEVLMNNFWNILLILNVSNPKHIYMTRGTSLSVILTSFTPSRRSGSCQRLSNQLDFDKIVLNFGSKYLSSQTTYRDVTDHFENARSVAMS